MLRKFALLTMLLGGMALPAQATTLTYLITGVIDSENASSLQVGDAMTATITVDLATPASFNPVPTLAQYAGSILSASFSLGGTAVGTGSLLGIQIADNHGSDEFTIGLLGGTLSGSLEGSGLGSVHIDLRDDQQGAFSSVALQVPTDITPFEVTQFFLDFASISSSISVQGRVTSIQFVPEPSIAALLGAGALAFARRRRRA